MILLIALLLLATLLRLYGLDAKSLWHDEIITLKRVTSGGVVDVLSRLLNKELPAPPLHFVLIHLVSFLGDADFLLRFPSAAFGVLSVAAVYSLAKVSFGRTEGLLAAFLLTLSPFQVRYSQEARAYALFMLLSVLALYFLWKGMRDHEGKWWVGFITSNILNLYTHLFAILVLVAEGPIFLSLWLWSLVRRQPKARPKVRQAFIQFLGSTAVVVACYLPMMPYLWQGIQGREGLGAGDFTPGMSLTPAFFAGVLGTFGAGSGAAFLIFATGFLAGLVGSFKKQGPQALLALLWIGVPFGVLFAFPAKHGFRPRYLVFILPLYLILVSKGLTTLGRLISNLLGSSSELRRRRFYAMWLLFSLLVFGVLGFFSVHKYYTEQRPDWRLAATFLAHNVAPGEVVVSRRVQPEIALRHYRRELSAVPFIQVKAQGSVPTTLQQERGIWFVGAGERSLPLTQQVLGSSGEPIVKIVFGLSAEQRSQAIAEGISPAMSQDIWIAYVREGVRVEELLPLYEDALSLATRYDSVDWIIPDILKFIREDSWRTTRQDAELRIVMQSHHVQASTFWLVTIRESYSELTMRELAREWSSAPVYPQLFEVDYLVLKDGSQGGVNREETVELLGDISGGSSPFLSEVFEVAEQYPLPDGDTVYLYRKKYHLDEEYNEDDYRTLAYDVEAIGGGDEAIIFEIPEQIEVFARHYQGTGTLYPLPRQHPMDEDATLLDLETIAADYDMIFTVLWQEKQVDPGHFVEGWLNRYGYRALSSWYGPVRLVVYASPLTREAETFKHHVQARFGEAITLLDYHLDSEEAKPGQILRVALFWKADDLVQEDYKVFIHLLDAQGQVLAQQDSPPVGGSRPTTGWVEGEIISDNHGVLIPWGTPLGEYQLVLGMYEPQTGERLSIISDGEVVGDYLPLTRIRIASS